VRKVGGFKMIVKIRIVEQGTCEKTDAFESRVNKYLSDGWIAAELDLVAAGFAMEENQ
jgi:hypothetical protein